MTNKEIDLREMAMELDHEAGSLNLAIATLQDIETNFGQVVEAIDNLDNPQDAAIYLREWKRDLNILSRLMHHTMNDAEEARQNIQYLKEGLFDGLVRNEK